MRSAGYDYTEDDVEMLYPDEYYDQLPEDIYGEDYGDGVASDAD